MTAYVEAPGEWGTLAKLWRKALEADNKSPNTIRIYLHAVRLLGEWATEHAETPVPITITKGHIREFTTALMGRTSPSNAHVNYRSLRTFFEFLVSEDEISHSPMVGTNPPFVPEKPVPIVKLDMMAALLETCKGKTFVARRDTAIIRTLWDTGGRLAEVSYLGLAAVDLDTDGIWVQGKGRRQRYIPIAPKTALALNRYLRVRAEHRQAAMSALWLGSTGQGALTHAGIKAVLIRRSTEANIGHVHPHMFRHALAHYWQLNGGNETDLMRIMGWKSREMLARYGESAAKERAYATARKLALGDRV